MSKSSDSGSANEEKKTNDLLALLYPDSADADVDESLYAGDEELASFRGLRDLFRELPEDEPSEAISNKLLALAAQHAPAAKSESRGVFAWLNSLFMPLVAHPGLAAAATLVLVAGVAGTMYVKGGAKVAEPTAASRAQPPSSAAPPPPPAEEPAMAPAAEPVTESANDEGAPGDFESASAEGGKNSIDSFKKNQKSAPAVIGGLSEQEALDFAGNLSADRDDNADAKSESRKRSGGDGLLGIGQSQSQPEAPKRRAQASEPAPDPKTEVKRGVTVKDIDTRDLPSPTGGAAGSTSTGSTSTGSTSTGSSASGNAKPAPPVLKTTTVNEGNKAPSKTPSKTLEQDKSEREEIAQDEAKEKQDANDSPASRAAALHTQARLAAKKNDCARVASLAQQIRALDSAYYDRSFLTDAALKACRESTAKKAKAKQ